MPLQYAITVYAITISHYTHDAVTVRHYSMLLLPYAITVIQLPPYAVTVCRFRTKPLPYAITVCHYSMLLLPYALTVFQLPYAVTVLGHATDVLIIITIDLGKYLSRPF